MINGQKKKSDVSGMEFFLVWFFICLPKDILDPILASPIFLGIGLVLNRVTDVVVMMILGLWALLRLKEFPTGSFFSAFTFEMVPILGAILPSWSGWILYVYIKQKIGEREMKVIKK
ncbi:MAG TPA: hypothetical protein ENL06_02505 [Candidatus Portnoybacteria bacterium]|nr:hypothetical protein [Candidatus Portnoybacteria bacterium]